MHMIPSISLLLLLSCSHLSIAKRGGGGSHGSSGDSDSGSSSSGGSDSGSSNSGSSSSGSTSSTTPQKCTLSQCDCARIDQRKDIYQRPASYYNGTLTITHRLSSNSAWDAAALHGGSGCAADDGQNKTYSYPALFAVGPNLNTADTNPIFWNLRAYPPVTKTQAQADVLVEFVHIRSADFAPGYGFSAGDEDSSYPSQTHTYWDTKIRLSAGAKTWDADAEYVAQPNEETAFVGATSSALKYRSSNYVTLTDICDYGQQFVLGASRGFPPTSPIPENVNRQNTFPTFFLNLGVKATVRGIGNDSLSFEMGSRVERQVVGVGKTNLCLGSSSPGAFYRTITALQWEKADRSSTTNNMYNVSATYRLSFEGQIVRENSTNIFPNSTAVPQWDIQSKVSKTASLSTSTSTSKISSSAVRPVLSPRVLYFLLAAFFWQLLGL
ncbi:MAG: hypothetical protein M1835_004974 [Candelina submexicana]|nr:MAG: hypothetical protein M1835_004974 [Candelina submexicana]